MPTSRRYRGLLATAALTALAAAAPAAASAAAVTVSGDDGNPIAVPAGAPPTIRNMRPDVAVAFAPGPGRYALTVVNAAGLAASSGLDCSSRSYGTSSRVNYSGNGAYTATVTTYADNDYTCAAPQSTEYFSFVIAASTALTPPPGRFLLRNPGSFSTNVFSLPVALNPGADSHEVRFAANATVGPDGAIVGASGETSPDTTTGRAPVRFDAPGVYTVVARPTRYTAAGLIGGPWSAPITVVAVGPFDVSGGLEIVDSRGPSYAVRIQLREKSARGRVTVALARGTKRGHYHSVGSALISNLGTVTKRFRVTRTSSYRLRFSYKGSQTILAGHATFPIRVTRRYAVGG